MSTKPLRQCSKCGEMRPHEARGLCSRCRQAQRRLPGWKPLPRPTLRDRLLSRLTLDANSPCLLWTGPLDRDGYGVIKVGTRNLRVHRVMWEMFEEPIPDGLVIDHVKARGCVNRHCASIAHLEPVPGRINTLRGDTVTAVNAAKTHCDSGHEFTLANIYRTPGGGRGCRACIRDRVARYNARKKAS